MAIVLVLCAALISSAITAIALQATGLHPDGMADTIIVYGLVAVVPVLLVGGLVFAVLRRQSQMAQRLGESEQRTRDDRSPRNQRRTTRVDSLTRLANRRAFFRHTQTARDHEVPSIVAVIDLDDFGSVNDAYGRDAGDAALREVGRYLGDRVHTNRVIARIGGEEFGVLITHAESPIAAISDLDDVRRGFHAIRPGLSVSIGVTDWDLSAGESIDKALARADVALYRAKQRGRDRVEFVHAGHEFSVGSSDLAPVARRRH